MVWEGKGVVLTGRKIIGASRSLQLVQSTAWSHDTNSSKRMAVHSQRANNDIYTGIQVPPSPLTLLPAQFAATTALMSAVT
jgi:hypothetical protein